MTPSLKQTSRLASAPLLVLMMSCQIQDSSVEAPEGLHLDSRVAPLALERQTSILALVSADRRQLEPVLPGVFSAHIPGVLSAELTADGLQATSSDDTIGLSTVAYGKRRIDGSEPALGGCAPGAETVGAACVRQVELDHGAITEWWASRDNGLEHGWTLHEAPASGLASITVGLSQGRLLSIDGDRLGASLLGSAGARWRYDELVAWDATGASVPAWLESDGDALVVRLDTAGADWPVTVDPLLGPAAFTEDKLTASDGAAYDVFGLAVAGAGDLDGDGYGDMVVGAYSDDDLGSSSGAVYVYYGSASGIDSSSEEKLTASDGTYAHYFSFSVADAGDVDGDGYDDFIVGAFGDADNGSLSGAAYVYHGSSSGIDSSSELKLTASDGAAEDYFGWSVAGAGDVDGDGYDDVLVGAYQDDDNGSESGSVYVYYGSSSGILAASEDKLVASDGATYDDFGLNVASAGDVDGDGYDDVTVGSPGDDDNGSRSGSAYVYYGSSSGIDASSEDKLSASDGAADDYFGYGVAGAGDVDGDGYDDLFISASFDDDNGSNSGSAYVYYGSSGGIDGGREDKVTASDGAANDSFGFGYSQGLAGAGDLDGDGYDDLVIGANDDDDNGANSGSVYVYWGSSSGIDLSTELKIISSDGYDSDDFGTSVAALGDVDGDGVPDIAVGASRDDDDGSASGSAYVYSFTDRVHSSDRNSSDQLGYSVAGAGDVDGDGYDDVVVGARFDDDDGDRSGSAYVYYGSAAGIDTRTEDKLTASDGAASDVFGTSVAGAGDVDGDGYDDVLIGAIGDDDMGSESGSAYVYFGSASGIDTSSEGKLSASDGAADDSYGFSVAGAGDLDGDGYGDVIVGAYADDDAGSESGSAYVYYGSSSGIIASSEHKLTASDAAADDEFGVSVAGGGDVDGDGYDDLVIGSRGDDDAGSGSGSAYVYYGTSSGIDASREDKLVASDGGAEDIFGNSVAVAGDMDADGYDDLVIGAYKDDDKGANAGGAYVYYGSSSGIDGSREDKLGASDGTDADYFGYAVAGAGDVDGDGYHDVLIGADRDDDNGSKSGSAYVYYGSASGVDGASEGKLTASDGAADDGFGISVAGAGDVDGDGTDDLIVGAYNANSMGSAYVYSGGCRDDDADGYCTSDGDCDDSDASVYPGATELTGDEVDSDCDGTETCYADADDDGYIDGSTTVASTDTDCSDSGEGLSTDGTGECDDSDASINPGATELAGDAVDSDCDGAEICYADADDDGYIDGSTTVVSTDTDCSDSGEGLIKDKTGECDDSDASINPGATELTGDEVDQDCDGAETCYADADDDGYIDGSTTVASTDTDCTDSGEGTSSDPTGECNDADGTINPGATELTGDEVDQDCDGTETCYADADDDGYTDTALTVDSEDTDCSDAGEGLATDPDEDCDDTDAAFHPGATEDDCTDPNDYNCDGSVAYADEDADGWVACEECDDADASVNPDATEVCDELDNDCDGTVDNDDAIDASTWYADADGDGYGDAAVSSTACEQPEESSADSTDCDDTDPDSYPGAAEIEDDGVDQDCDGEDAVSPVDSGGDGGSGDDGKDGCGGCAANGVGGQSGLFLLLALGLGVRRREVEALKGSV